MKGDTMSDEETTEATTDEGAKPEKKKAEPKTLTVRVLRAVDGYHHRTVLTVPNDEYHRGLLKQGNLKAVE